MQRLVVKVNLPYLELFRHSTERDLVYSWSGKEPLVEGDRVLIPPTKLMPNEQFIGVVISTDASHSDYQGPAKELLGKVV